VEEEMINLLVLPKQAQIEIARAIDCLADTPRPSGCKKLRGTDLWRLRVGRYRVVYAIDDEDRLVTVIKVAPTAGSYLSGAVIFPASSPLGGED